jgi:hypothetical protein
MTRRAADRELPWRLVDLGLMGHDIATGAAVDRE